MWRELTDQVLPPPLPIWPPGEGKLFPAPGPFAKGSRVPQSPVKDRQLPCNSLGTPPGGRRELLPAWGTGLQVRLSVPHKAASGCGGVGFVVWEHPLLLTPPTMGLCPFPSWAKQKQSPSCPKEEGACYFDFFCCLLVSFFPQTLSGPGLRAAPLGGVPRSSLGC